MSSLIYFINYRKRYGYKFTEMFSELVAVEPDAPLDPVPYCFSTMLEFLDLAIRILDTNTKEFENLSVEFANAFGPLKCDERTFLDDFVNLGLAMKTVYKEGRQKMYSGVDLSPEFSVRIVDCQDKSGHIKTAIEPLSLKDAIWFDFLLNGTNGYRQCEYLLRFSEKRKGCVPWISISRASTKWCSDACRMSAARRAHKEKLKG